MDAIRVGIIGWGLSGRCFHGGFIHAADGFTITRVATSQAVDRTRYGSVHVEQNAAAVATADDVDLVVVASPNTLHVEHATLALDANKHVVIEKPLARTASEIRHLIKRANAANRRLIPFQNRRYDGDFLTVKQLLEQDTLGAVHAFESRWPAYRPLPKQRSPWKAEPDVMHGVLYDLGPHLIDQTLVLFGRPSAVSANVQILRPSSTVVDRFDLRLHYPSGPDVHLEVDQLDPTERPRFVVRGQNATFEKYGIDAQEAAIRADHHPAEEGWGEDDPKRYGRLFTADKIRRIPTERGDYGVFYRAVHEAIRGDAAAPIDPRDVVDQLVIIEAALASSNAGQKTEVLSW